MEVRTTTFRLDTETKRTWRYAEEAPPSEQLIGTLYMQKSQTPDPPDFISIRLATKPGPRGPRKK
jgi:hypothetical protein